MDESFQASGNRFPSGEPDDDWTIEELIRWSLDRHQASAMDRTASSISLLRDRCEGECEDVMTLHAMAVEIEEGGGGGGGGKEKGGEGAVGGAVDEENVDPQRMSLDGADAAVGRIATSKTTTGGSSSTTDDDDVAFESIAAPDDPPPSPSSSSSNSTIAVQVTSGPHAPSRFHLRPRPGGPCLVGRSKGKKFVKNGISLHRDQEISTTHGKFVMVEGDGGRVGSSPRYYFVDVGSTNGTVYDGAALVPNVRLPLVDGMELKVGNSMLRIVLC